MYSIPVALRPTLLSSASLVLSLAGDVVLSNSDGCAIARSNEAKALVIKMGAPWFQIRHLADSDGLVALSANFTLYGDVSDRMMSLAAGLGPTQEIYLSAPVEF